MSLADKYFKEEVNEILTNGFNDQDYQVRPVWIDYDENGNEIRTSAHTIKVPCIVNRYNLQEEFPILTLRNAPFKYAVKEMLWIFQKKSNNINELDSHNWDSWADETGSIGKTYGYVAGEKYKYPELEEPVDQIDYILWCLKNNPMNRRMIIQLYKPDYIIESGLPPCLASYYFSATDEFLDMTAIMRSSDAYMAAGAGISDEMGMGILLSMFAQVSGLKPRYLTVVKNNFHCYDRYVGIIQKICKNPEYPAPKLIINQDVKNFYDFKLEDFKLDNYQYTKVSEKPPVAI